VEGGGGLDEGAAAALVEGEQVGLELGGELVLAGLAGHHDREGASGAGLDSADHRLGGLELVGVERATDDFGAETGKGTEGTRLVLGDGCWGTRADSWWRGALPEGHGGPPS
jgi:hypothetical protein